jgi:TP901 family phage tail tape measure protein
MATQASVTFLINLLMRGGDDVRAQMAAFNGAVSGSQSQVQQLSVSAQQLEAKITHTGHSMAQVMAQTAGATTQSTQRQMSALERLGDKFDSVRQRMRDGLPAFQQKMTHAGTMAGGAAIVGSALVRPYAELESAVTDLKMSLMDARGAVGSEFGGIMKAAADMGNTLPGTTKDFVAAAVTLKKLGMSTDKLEAGMRAAGEMAVILQIDPAQAAMLVSKSAEGYKLAGDELPKFANWLQKVSYASGLNPEQMKESIAYQSATTGMLGIKGFEKAKVNTAIMAMGGQNSLEGSSFGTNYAQMLQRLSKGPELMAQAKKGMKASAQAQLDKAGIKFDFFDKKGNFVGERAMVKELEKIKTIKNLFGEKAAMDIANAMFGDQGSRPALLLAEEGVKGLDKMVADIENRAESSLMLKARTDTYKGHKDALEGTFEGLKATVGEPLGEALKPVISMANKVVGEAADYLKENKHLAAQVGAVSVGAGAIAAKGVWDFVAQKLGGNVGAVLNKSPALLGAGGAAVAAATTAISQLKGPMPVIVVNAAELRGLGGGAAPTGGQNKGVILGADGKPINTTAAAAGAAGAAAAGQVAVEAVKKAGVLSQAGQFLKGAARTGAFSVAIGAMEAGTVIYDDKKDKSQKAYEVGEITASTAGGVLGGAAAGALVGSVVPIIGTAIGALIGGLAGSWAGGAGYRALIDSPEKRRQDALDKMQFGRGKRGDLPESPLPEFLTDANGTPLSGSLTQSPAYLAANNPSANPQMQAALETLKQPTKVELQPSQMTIKIDTPEGYNATAQLTSPSFKLDGGSTAPWARN